MPGAKTPTEYVERAASLALTDPRGSIAAFDEGLERFPDDADLLEGKVVFANHFGLVDVALEASRRWADSTDSTGAWYSLGRALQDVARNEEALAAYRRAVEVDAHHADAWINLGSLLDDRHEHTEAIGAYDRALADAPEDEMAWSNKGNSLLALGRFDEAASCYAHVGQVERQRQALAYAGCLDDVRGLQAKASPAQGELREQTRPLEGRRLVARYFIGTHTNPELLDQAVTDLLEFAASRVGVGRGIADGVTLLYHWMVVTVRERGTDLVLCEPASGSDILRLRDEVTFSAFAAVQVVAQHASLGCEPEHCTAAQTVSVQLGAGDDDRTMAVRERPRHDNDSGWRLVDELDPDGPYTEVPVLRVFNRLPGLAMLPVGWRIEFRESQISRVLDPEGVDRTRR